MATQIQFTSTKDCTGFSSRIFRWIWQFYTWRLTQSGRWFMWATVCFLAYTATSLDYQSYIAFSFAFSFWLFALGCMFIARPRVVLDAQHSDRVCAGETLRIDIQATATATPFFADLHVIAHRLSPHIDAVEEDGVPLPPLSKNQRTRAALSLLCKQRGIHSLPALRVETDLPFGLLRAWRVTTLDRKILVYPQFQPLARLEIPTGRRYQPGGVAMVSVVGDSLEYVGNREYREGDNLRDIDWRATARLSRPIVREYREEYFLRVAVILDTHIPIKGGRLDERRKAFECAVSLSASVGDYLARQEYVVDLFAAGPHLYHLMAGRGLAYLEQILDILACVDESPTEPFDIIAPELMNNLSRISTVICVMLNWNPSRRKFVEMLHDQGVGMKVVVVRDTPCEIDPALDGLRQISTSEWQRGIGEL